MKKRRLFRSDESGQVLVQVAISLVVLLGFVALAVDVGNAYGERRHMQNAADAAALAGARELCLGNGADAAAAKAREYLLLNEVVAGDIQAGDISINNNIVDVTARVSADTFLAGILGINIIDVSADAAAACGAATSACGLWPVAFDRGMWELLADPAIFGCGSQFAVWSDSNDVQELTCEVDGVPEDNVCNCYDCDLDDDGTDDFAVLNGEGRAWLDFSEAVLPYTDACTAPGCGASELACHIRSDAGARIDLPTCISGDSGVKAGVKDDVESRVGDPDPLHIVLFDGNCDGETSNCPGGDTYRAVSFGCIRVVGWEQNLKLEPLDTSLYKTERGKVIWASVACESCMTDCGATNGRPPEPWELTAVSLIR